MQDLFYNFERDYITHYNYISMEVMELMYMTHNFFWFLDYIFTVLFEMHVNIRHEITILRRYNDIRVTFTKPKKILMAMMRYYF